MFKLLLLLGVSLIAILIYLFYNPKLDTIVNNNHKYIVLWYNRVKDSNQEDVCKRDYIILFAIEL